MADQTAVFLADARLAGAFFAAVAVFVAATLTVFPTGALAVLDAGVLAAVLRVAVLRAAGFFGASSLVVWLAVKCRPAFFGAAPSSEAASVRLEVRFAAPNLTSLSPQISSKRY
jgi:hypothetical protein